MMNDKGILELVMDRLFTKTRLNEIPNTRVSNVKRREFQNGSVKATYQSTYNNIVSDQRELEILDIELADGRILVNIESRIHGLNGETLKNPYHARVHRIWKGERTERIEVVPSDLDPLINYVKHELNEAKVYKE